MARALIAGMWIAWIAYWFLAARTVKPARERQSAASRLGFVLAMAIVAALLGLHRLSGVLAVRLVGGGWTRYWCAVALVAAGLGFSIWARIILGGNWSGSVTVKVGHELIQRGPYRHIRHPIYTGIILALLGTGLAAGQVRGFLGFAIGFVTLWLKSRVEERWMTREFGERYAAYRQSSWALIPFVL
ncbi:MAG TPA: isoprenylcysteine carboxylmethyltransferase family protein [Steroidobacteraceae bacterium]|nr:isoprenylcysteine carboxylmethyltransferase family protein [Steroidobacteraceae bacterium]